MKRFIYKVHVRARNARAFLLCCALCFSISIFGAGWTPTDAGLVIAFEDGDQFLLSTMIDGEEYFVCHYPSYTGGKFDYAAGNFLKLIPQAPGATVPSESSVWSIDTALTRVKSGTNYALGGISYTMWSSSTYTLVTNNNSTFKFLGDLSNNKNNNNLCDVVFVVPTNRSTDVDPNHTLGHAGAFDGEMGVGFAGMVYREVYMFNIPRLNPPYAYTNAALVTFNTTNTIKKWSNNDITCQPGMAAYAYADEKHKPTTRTLFRIYVLNKPFSSCSGYFFGYDTQDYLKYRNTEKIPGNSKDSTNARKIYTLDHFYCMEQVEGKPFYQTAGMKVPARDSVYYYVGYNNRYHSAKDMGTGGGAASQFTPIDSLRIRALRDADKTYNPSRNAYGYMAINPNTTADNLGVTFEPAGYFLKVSTGKNVRMVPNEDRTVWTSEEMWTISEEWSRLQIKATLFTGPEFSETDPGADIAGWSQFVKGTDVPVSDGTSVVGKSGWARIYVDRDTINGAMEFLLAEKSKCLHYDNNGLIGTQIPDQYPLDGGNTVIVQDARLKAGFTFLGWATVKGGPVVYFPRDSIGQEHYIGEEITLTADSTNLYAVGKFNDTYRVAFSFIHDDGKRYFVTHPNSSAPRFARARHFDDWTDVYQGMSDAENTEPNYISTYKMLGNPGVCEECATDEYVLDPQHEVVHGVEDSLIFYEHWAPANDEYIGLYYEDPNTLLANNTWAGIFKSTEGWPAYNRTAVDNTKIYSTDYFSGVLAKEGITKHPRQTDPADPATALPAYLKYTENNQFDGVEAEDATEFQITGIAVADAHYVILPDTVTEPWTNEIVFDYHEDEQTRKQVWSKLIGKQLMACLRVGPDTVYFHPNRDKIFTTANELRLSTDFRLTQSFSYIRDARVESLSTVSAEDKPSMTPTENDFSCIITSGVSSPTDVIYQGTPIDIVDTLRVRLTQGGISRIKKYYGRWNDRADGVHVSGSSRYRDILIRTKTYHYGEEQTRLALVPEFESYSFGPLEGQNRQLNFTLTRQTYRTLYDTENNPAGENISKIDTLEGLALAHSYCSFSSGSAFYVPEDETTSGNHVNVVTQADNTGEVNYDTLIVSIVVGSVPVSVRVPLMQTTLTNNELIWSVVDESTRQRYFITAGTSGTNGLIYRQYTQNGSTLYKKGTTNAVLKKGSKDAANSDGQYITPWQYKISASQSSQLTMKAVLTASDTLHFAIAGETTPTAGSDSTLLTFRYAGTYTNDNANYEELVRIKFGADKWLKFSVTAGVPSLGLQADSATATVFSWGYLQHEYNLLNNGEYPSLEYAEFDHDNTSSVHIQTRYKAYREYSMLLGGNVTYLCREEESDIADLKNESGDWKVDYDIQLLHDCRFGCAKDSAKLDKSTDATTLITTVTPSGDSPLGTQYGGKYVNIVDTLQVSLVPLTDAPEYRFKGDWSGYKSIDEAQVKIPLIRKTYHEAPFDSLVCVVENDEYNFAFPSTITEDVNDTHEFVLGTERRQGTQILDVDNHSVSSVITKTTNLTGNMHLNEIAYAEIRLVDEYGSTPRWCEIADTTANTVTVRCKANGIRSPRSAYLYFAYIISYVEDEETVTRYVNFRLTVSQASLYQYANNQHLIHSKGASGDPLMEDGRQQVHENKRILYYYNPYPYNIPDQNVELPVRERAFYGWWRWYREGKDEKGNDVSDADVLDSLWIAPPRNVGKFNYPFRTIGDSVWVDENDHDKGKKLVTMGRYTVFHYPAVQYNSKADPPAKSPLVAPPFNKDTLTYVVDISNYYDNLPLSMAEMNQIDTALLDTLREIIEPTLSLREVFELHPWTEMAARLDTFKYEDGTPWKDQKYMEDHVVMAPTGNRLLLSTEQRYKYQNLQKGGHSESLLGYYMRDDHWEDSGWDPARKDTMIWCGGWDADCLWYTYKPGTGYSPCNYEISEGDDFLKVPAKSSLPAGKETDTVYYCLRARSQSTTGEPRVNEETVDGRYMFNICRYTVIYHRPAKYGPLREEKKNAGAIITDEEIEQNYEVLERLNFDYNHPGSEYQVYPHPLPWADASYGYSYPVSPELPDNRYHNDFAPNFAGTGEYGLINRIPYSQYWHQMEQHGGAENGYMIYCDGMSSSGQVAALTLHTQLCEGQQMYLSAYVGNPSSQSGKSNPNFTFSVQGSEDGEVWEDITTYTTGDIQPSDKWNQIVFPITYNQKERDYEHFRVQIYNVASSFDGNDFIIDDICLYATKPPLIAYQANTTCEQETNDLTHVILRIDYQGVNNDAYNGKNVYYTIEKVTPGNDTTFVKLEDKYIHQAIKEDTIYGYIKMPTRDYEPTDADSVFTNITDLVLKFETTFEADKDHPFQQGYVYESVDNVIRPVMYVVHKAKVTPENTYTVRMSAEFKELMNSICAMTSTIKISNRMMLVVNEKEHHQKEIEDLCANTTYDISLLVKGSLYLDSVAPIELNGSCINDWLLYGDTTEASSEVRYGYKYSDIVKVITQILRNESESNTNRFAPNFSSVSRSVMETMSAGVTLSDGVVAYDLLDSLVSKGFLTLYRSKITATLPSDSLQYAVMPITGTGYDEELQTEVDVCPNPIVIKLKPGKDADLPLSIGGLHRDSTESSSPIVVLADEQTANDQIAIPIDSINSNVVVDSILLTSTNDPNYLEGVHMLRLTPDKIYDFAGENPDYYENGDTILLSPITANTYHMRPGYSYTFVITMKTRAGNDTIDGGCRVGVVPFVLSVVPAYLRWAPKSAENNQWNNPENWIGITQSNQPIHEDAHFAPFATTSVVIPTLSDGLPYPELPDTTRLSSQDSVKQVGFQYNRCDNIRFMPGTTIGQQQRLNYSSAIVDMSMPQQKWAFRSAPVKGLLSGDIFMANADINWETSPWEVGAFDANGRSHSTGNASFWLSVYSRTTTHKGNKDDVDDEERTAGAEWSKVTNAMTLSLPPAQGWAVYARTSSGSNAAVRLPKNDDIYYYFNRDGEKMLDIYEQDLRATRNGLANDSAGALAFYPSGTSQGYELTNQVSSASFVFGNPTMAYIDIWGFIADNSAKGVIEEFDYLDESGVSSVYTTVTKESLGTNELSNPRRYLPPMRAIVIKKSADATSLTVTLNTSRVVTQVVVPPVSPAPKRKVAAASVNKGIMTITAINPASSRCTSKLLLGQGYHNAIVEGEDAVLTTINIDNYSTTSAPATPFNIYAAEDGYGLSIDLRDSLVNVPISFYMSELTYEPVTHLWFTGVNNIDGTLVLYDALTGNEQLIVDGICLDIETPDSSHQTRYYIRRKGYTPKESSDPIATGIEGLMTDGASAVKIVKNGIIYILHNGHVYTLFGQKIR